MTAPPPSAHPLILLATDLGLRCDRAIERAALLARSAGTVPVATTVVEPGQRLSQQVPTQELPDWYRAPAPLARAERQLQRDLAPTGLRWRTHVEEGNAGECLLRLLAGETAGAGGIPPLVVTGPVREGVLGGSTIGSTLDRLLRRPSTSLLIARQRAQGDYRHLVVASDFSAPSKAALQAARALFPKARITLLHGFEIPLLGLLDTTRDSAVEQARERLHEEARAFLRDAELDAANSDTVIEYGDPARLLRQYAEIHEPDLAVVGTHGRGAVYDIVIGSVAKRILAASPLDTLLVRA